MFHSLLSTSLQSKCLFPPRYKLSVIPSPNEKSSGRVCACRLETETRFFICRSAETYCNLLLFLLAPSEKENNEKKENMPFFCSKHRVPVVNGECHMQVIRFFETSNVSLATHRGTMKITIAKTFERRGVTLLFHAF